MANDGRARACPAASTPPPAAPMTRPTSGKAQSEEMKSGGWSSLKRCQVTGIRLSRRKAEAQSPVRDCLPVLASVVMPSC